MRILQRPTRALAPVLAAAATAGVMATAVPAAAGDGKLVQRPAIVGASVMRWLNPAPKAAALSKRERKVMAGRLDSRHGRGTYICTASGFGKRPSCFTR
ncbi:hypothetical protein [Rhodovulum marinum]|uniref:Uncharacterized protein n=1 Tax=Rhodovulum marinum TaxID=320662 RepID=A0A4R2PST7_9RHOB|nr:hypothetical protein [Rhodovulum marinum]TCP39023.1 hypothetical protein EV662_11565 [Rhodovulum marinum]